MHGVPPGSMIGKRPNREGWFGHTSHIDAFQGRPHPAGCPKPSPALEIDA